MGYHVAVPVLWEPIGRIINPAYAYETPGAFLPSQSEVIGAIQIGMRTERMFGELTSMMVKAGFLTASITLLSILIAIDLMRRWLKPLLEVTNTAIAIQSTGIRSFIEEAKSNEKGEANLISSQKTLSRHDEIGQLCHTFSAMIQELGEHDRRLKEQKAHLVKMVERRTEEAFKAKENAEQANRSKSVFLASMSHELRAPLEAIINFSEKLKLCNEQINSRNNKEYLETINSSGRKLLSLINDILDFSRLETSTYVVQPSSFPLRKCLDAAIQANEQRILHRYLQIDLACEDLEVFTDWHALMQSISNLVSNAARFSPVHGHIRVLARSVGSDISIEIIDAGCGMTEQELAHALVPFTQIERVSSGSDGAGTGLGLPLVRHFVRLMSGKVYFFSEPEEGTVVKMIIPKTIKASLSKY